MANTARMTPRVPPESAELIREMAGWDQWTAAARIESGLAPAALDALQASLGLSSRELADTLQISARTLARRRTQSKLPPGESERTLRIVRLVNLGIDTLGGQDQTSQWMREPNYALNDRAPLHVMRTEPGADMVETLLRRIDNGLPV